MLQVVDPNREFEVCTDAFNEGVGALLTQDGKVITYESRNIKDGEQWYFAYDLQLTVVVHALRVWRHCLLGKRFVLGTNHNSLTSYFKKVDLNARQARWNVFLSKFDLDIQHVKSKENYVKDDLGRKIHGIYELYFNHTQFMFQEQINEASKRDFEYQFLW